MYSCKLVQPEVSADAITSPARPTNGHTDFAAGIGTLTICANGANVGRISVSLDNLHLIGSPKRPGVRDRDLPKSPDWHHHSERWLFGFVRISNLDISGTPLLSRTCVIATRRPRTKSGQV